MGVRPSLFRRHVRETVVWKKCLSLRVAMMRYDKKKPASLTIREDLRVLTGNHGLFR